MSEAEIKKRRPVKRWIVLVMILAGIFCAFIAPAQLGWTILKPVPPVVVLPGEPTGLVIGSFEITNTILATLLADILLILMGIGAWRFAKSGKLVPEGFYNAFEAIVEFLWNTTSGAAEKKWAKRMFPLVATIFLLIFVANMVKMIPGFESIGHMHESPHGEGYAPVELLPGRDRLAT